MGRNPAAARETVASIPGWSTPSADQPDAPARGSAASVRSAGDPTLAGASGRYPTGIRAPPGPQRDLAPVTSLQSPQLPVEDRFHLAGDRLPGSRTPGTGNSELATTDGLLRFLR